MESHRETYFVSGATGFIGMHLSLLLAGKGHQVHALVRSEAKARNIFHPQVRLFYGDILDKDSIHKAMNGCDGAFHLAAFAKPWSEDPALPYRVNVEATGELLSIARRAGVKKFVFTSSAATLGTSPDGEVIDEETPHKSAFFNQYDSTKSLAEEIVREAGGNGLDTVIVNPTRVYGPGLLSVSNSLVRIMIRYLKGSWRIIPGSGKELGNYVYVDDVVKGHILAMEKGRAGQRYILGGENLSFDEVFRTIREISGQARWLVHTPYAVARPVSYLLYYGSRMIGTEPPITPSWVKKFLSNTLISSRKAETELGYTITPFREGAGMTIDWIRKNHLS